MNENLSLSHALRLKSAEYWLELGEPKQAMCELRKLPGPARRHPRSVRTFVAVAGALRRTNQLTPCAQPPSNR